MPMIPEAVFAMLACARIGAIHSVVFGGFASVSLASRIDDAEPTRDRQRRRRQPRRQGGRLQAAARRGDPPGARTSRRKVLLVDRGLAPMERVRRPRRRLRARCASATSTTRVPCAWVDADAPELHALHQRHHRQAEGRAARHRRLRGGAGGEHEAHLPAASAGETYFSTSDIGWVVGHSYIVYGPLIAGMATILYEGLPIRPDAGIWWSLVEKYRVTAMFTAPTAMRVLKKQDPTYLRAARPVVAARAVPGRRAARRADRALDRRGARQADHRQLLADRDRLADPDRSPTASSRRRASSAARACRCTATTCKLLDETTGAGHRRAEPEGRGRRSRGRCRPAACRPCGATTRASSRPTGTAIPGRLVYSTFDWGIRDDDGYYFILGRTDDVINVAGHRLGTREIEESISSHPNVAEVAVVGVADALKGQVAMAFVGRRRTPRALADARGAAASSRARS